MNLSPSDNSGADKQRGVGGEGERRKEEKNLWDEALEFLGSIPGTIVSHSS